MKRAALFLVAFVACFGPGLRAGATPPPKWQNEANADTCGGSFAERLADFRAAIPAQQRYMAEYNRVMPWWTEHCWWLTPREIAIRQIDDPDAFVCDTKAGRPKGLTSDVVMEHQAPRDANSFIEYSQENRWCEPFDVAAGRVSLRLGQYESPAEQARIILTGMCWQVTSAKCDKARAALAAAAAATP